MNGLKKLVSAANANFEDMEDYRRHLEFDFPKIGNDDDSVDKELTFLFDAFADAAEKFRGPMIESVPEPEVPCIISGWQIPN